MKKLISIVLSLSILSLTACAKTDDSKSSSDPAPSASSNSAEQSSDSDITALNSDLSAEEITASLTLEQKLEQMMIPAIYNIKSEEMSVSDYGSILSVYDPVTKNASDWSELIHQYQENAMNSDARIPFLYGQDSVHGVNYSVGTVIFPHNINLGNADDPELTYQMGLAVADEMKMTKMIWNYAPCVASAQDPRWGRTYESYSSDPEIVGRLSESFVKGQLDGGVIVCPKHFIGDGNTKYGTGESAIFSLIDRGNSEMNETEIKEQLAVYKKLIDLGAQSIMVSHSALNGVKMHENKTYLTDVLRGQLGFEGVIVSDWESIHNITSTDKFDEQLITAVNAGIDWIMEPAVYTECVNILKTAVENGKVSESRIDDAVTRIIQLKKDAGLFDDPYLENLSTKQTVTGSEEYRDLARKLAEESLVLLKNDNDVLPLKKDTKIFVTGPAANDTGVQCGGWTRCWTGHTDAENGSKWIAEGTTILEGLNSAAAEYGLTIITDSKKANDADLTLLCLGEQPYAEWYGDSSDISITGKSALTGNKKAIEQAKELGKPTVTLLLTGRNVIISDYMNDWDAVVMCGLFGSEGDCAANVLTGKSVFTGKLAMPWYAATEDIGTDNVLYNAGYGITTDE